MAGNANNILVGAATMAIDGTDVGYTRGGVSIRYEPSFVTVTADQAIGTVAMFKSNERMVVTTTMLEVTLNNIRIAFGQPPGNLVGSTLTLGYNSACYLQDHAITIVGVDPGCGPRTISIFSAVAIGNREFKMQRDAETVLEIELECLKNPNGIFGTIVDS